jgi:hypothetical protein
MHIVLLQPLNQGACGQTHHSAMCPLQLTPAITEPAITDNPAITDFPPEIRYLFSGVSPRDFFFGVTTLYNGSNFAISAIRYNESRLYLPLSLPEHCTCSGHNAEAICQRYNTPLCARRCHHSTACVDAPMPLQFSLLRCSK